MSKGFCGKILWVDLSNDSFKEVLLADEIYRQFIGGYGLGCKLIFDNMKKGTNPLEPDSIFGFFPGLLTGTPAPFSGRYMVAGKSPLTGTWGDANSGGTFGPEIKRCGYDAILFKGQANSPKYVAIIDDAKEILDASEIWGTDILQAEDFLKKKHGKFIKTAGIGQAGEKLSRISGIVNDRGRIAARSGIGAIMGSKNLKMLVLKGKNKIEYDDKAKFMEHVKAYNVKGKIKPPGRMMSAILKKIPNMAKMMRRFNMGMGGPLGIMRQIYHNLGTISGNTLLAETGDSPIKNWSGIGMYDFPFGISKELSSNNIIKYKIREYGCFSCPIQCGGILKVPELDLEETHQPEYETCSAFGSLLLNNDLLSIIEINELCNKAAIDTISVGGTVAFALECYENGILTKNDTDGLELTWGNSKAIIELVKKIIKREGIGDILADGCKMAAEKIGKGSEKYAIHSMGQELALHDPKKIPSLGFSYAYDPSPGKHTTATIDMTEIGPVEKFLQGISLPKGWKNDEKKKIKAQKIVSGFQQTLYCAGLCAFSTIFGPYPFLELINSLTGWNMTIDECLETGLRIQTLRQVFTLREGIDIVNNKLNDRVVGNPPFDKGPTKGITVDYIKFYKEFCREMDWNPDNGYPSKESLRNLNLGYLINDLY